MKNRIERSPLQAVFASMAFATALGVARPTALAAELPGSPRVLKPEVRLMQAPLKPLRAVQPDPCVLLGRSAFMAPGDGRGDITPVYEPVEDGGFKLTGGARQFNRPVDRRGGHDGRYGAATRSTLTQATPEKK